MYKEAGADAFAHRLKYLFVPIKTEADKALHDDILRELLLIVDGKERKLLEQITEYVLYKPIKRHKRFLFRMAERILEMGTPKGQG